MKVLPNLFIVGAPKSGTTSLSQYLRYHPNVFMSSPKEPHYFADDFDGHRRFRVFSDYMSLFNSVTLDHLAIGEASVWYLYSHKAINNVHNFNPCARLIVMLRHPIDLVYSFHSQCVYSFYENCQNFEMAWSLQEQRKEGYCIPKTCRQPEFLQYAEIGRLGAQLERLLSIFPREQVHIIFFDDFIKDTQKCYQDVLNFLQVPDDRRVSFPRINENKSHRNLALSRILQDCNNKPAVWLRRLDSIIRYKIPYGSKLNLLEYVTNFTVIQKKRQPLPVHLRQQLLRTFDNDIEKLAFLTGKDLSHWKSCSSIS